MRYINRKTGAVVETDCTIEGGLWIPETGTASESKPEEAPQVEEKPAKVGKGRAKK